MLRNVVVLGLAMGTFCLQGHAKTHKTQRATKDDNPAITAPAITSQQEVDQTTPVDLQKHIEADVRIISSPAKDGYDKAAFWVSLMLAIVGGCGVAAGIFTLILIRLQVVEMRRQRISMEKTLIALKRQTVASEKTVKHMVASERPFLMVETRGTLGTEFWFRNCGKSPAQIIFLDMAYKLKFPEFVQEQQDFVMPYPPQYGSHYDDPLSEQINVQWVAPGDEKCFTSFDTSIFSYLSQELKDELNAGFRAVRIYSAIKYRGMFSEEIFESRFCYGWSSTNGTRMTGPFGYNKYT